MDGCRRCGAHFREAGAQAFLSRSADTQPAERPRAEHANEVAADLIVGFCHPRTDVAGVFYFDRRRPTARPGLRSQPVSPHASESAAGRSTPLLRATWAPAVVISLPASTQHSSVAPWCERSTRGLERRSQSVNGV